MPRNWNTVPGNTPIQDGETLWLNPDEITWQSHKFATTKADVGLGNADNTADLDKPISDATQHSLDHKADLVGGRVPTCQIPAIAITHFLGEVSDEVSMLSLTGEIGDWTIRTDLGVTYILVGDDPSIIGDWVQLEHPDSPVISVNGQIGTVVLGYEDVGADEEGSASQALNQAKSYTDNEIDSLATVASTGSYNDLADKPTQVSSDWNATSGIPQILNKPTIPKLHTASGTTTSGNITFNISAASFSSLTQGGCQFRVNEDDNSYSFEVTSLSLTSVTVSVKQRSFSGVSVLGVGVLGSTTMNAVPNGTTVHALFIGT